MPWKDGENPIAKFAVRNHFDFAIYAAMLLSGLLTLNFGTWWLSLAGGTAMFCLQYWLWRPNGWGRRRHERLRG